MEDISDKDVPFKRDNLYISQRNLPVDIRSDKKYRNTYVYVRQLAWGDQLYYIDSDGLPEKVNILDLALFQKKHLQLSRQKGFKDLLTHPNLHLTDAELKDLITSNGGHTPEFKLQIKEETSFELEATMKELVDYMQSFTKTSADTDPAEGNKLDILWHKFITTLRAHPHAETFIKNLTLAEWSDLIGGLEIINNLNGQEESTIIAPYKKEPIVPSRLRSDTIEFLQYLQQASPDVKSEVIRENCKVLLNFVQGLKRANLGVELSEKYFSVEVDLLQQLLELSTENPLASAQQNILEALAHDAINHEQLVRDPRGLNNISLLHMVFDGLQERPEAMLAVIKTFKEYRKKYLDDPHILQNMMYAIKKEGSAAQLALQLFGLMSREGFDSTRDLSQNDWLILFDVAVKQTAPQIQESLFEKACQYSAGQHAVWEHLRSPQSLQAKQKSCEKIVKQISEGQWPDKLLQLADSQEWSMLIDEFVQQQSLPKLLEILQKFQDCWSVIKRDDRKKLIHAVIEMKDRELALGLFKLAKMFDVHQTFRSVEHEDLTALLEIAIDYDQEMAAMMLELGILERLSPEKACSFLLKQVQASQPPETLLFYAFRHKQALLPVLLDKIMSFNQPEVVMETCGKIVSDMYAKDGKVHIYNNNYNQHYAGKNNRVERQAWLMFFASELEQLKIASLQEPNNSKLQKAYVNATQLFSALRSQFHDYDKYSRLSNDEVKKIQDSCKNVLDESKSVILAGISEVTRIQNSLDTEAAKKAGFIRPKISLDVSVGARFDMLKTLVEAMPLKTPVTKRGTTFSREDDRIPKVDYDEDYVPGIDL